MPLSRSKILFKIPIYRESSDKYYEYLTNKRSKSVERRSASIKRIGLDRNGQIEKQLRNNLPSINPQCIYWNYNRIIGWIEFYADGGIIKAALWFSRSKKIRKDFGKQIIDCVGKISDVSETYNKDNDLIRKDLRDFISDFMLGKFGNRYKKYYLDSTEFLKLIEYLDIKRMIEKNCGIDQ
ncbi:MAG: hypothetical protein NTW12_13085 [Deltaproteobacteria bacterium]|nr:hypothetical protein [Deltaproteobacteria bacterium]